MTEPLTVGVTIQGYAAAIIVASGGSTPIFINPMLSISYENTVNHGISWSATFIGLTGFEFGDTLYNDLKPLLRTASDGQALPWPARALTVAPGWNSDAQWSGTPPYYNASAYPAYTVQEFWPVVQILAYSDAGDFVSTPLKIMQMVPKETTKGMEITIAGIDMVTWALSTEGVSQYTAMNNSVRALLDSSDPLNGPPLVGNDILSIAKLVNDPSNPSVVLSVEVPEGAPALTDVEIMEYDLKAGALKSHMDRLLGDSAYNYYVTATNTVVALPCTETNQSLGTHATPDMSCIQAIEAPRLEENCVDILRMRKISKYKNTFIFTANTKGIQTGSFPYPFQVTGITILTATGCFVAYAATFDKDLALAYYMETNYAGTDVVKLPIITPSSLSPSRTITWDVGANSNASVPILARILVTGTPVPYTGWSDPGYDFAFEVDYPVPYIPPHVSTSAQLPIPRTKIVTIESPTWPSAGYVGGSDMLIGPGIQTSHHTIGMGDGGMNGIISAKWVEAQKSAHPVTVQLSRFDPTWLPCDAFNFSNGVTTENARIESVSWSLSPKSKTQSLKGYVPMPLPSGANAWLMGLSN